MTTIQYGLFNYLVAGKFATLGTINETIEAVTSNNKNAIIDKTNTKVRVEVPSWFTYNGNTYTVIVIGQQAFRVTNITYAYIPRTVKSLLNYAFDWCYKLERIDFEPDSSLTFIVISFLVNSSIRTLRLPPYVNTIGVNFLTYYNTIRSIYFAGFAPTCSKDLSSYNLSVYVYPNYDSTKFCNKIITTTKVFPTKIMYSCKMTNFQLPKFTILAFMQIF